MKTEIFCLVRKKNIIIDARLAKALVKMKRAVYVHPAPVIEEPEVIKPAVIDEDVEKKSFYSTKVMVADVGYDSHPKKRGRRKKDSNE